MSVYSELVGQSHIVLALQDAVRASRSEENSQDMTHAWLFTGPPGSGRSSAALAFAASLVCPESGCGVCIDCRSVKSGGHADVEVIATEGLSIKIDEVRDLLQRVAWAPSVGGWRVVVMEDADRLTESAANALLKAIEEPGTRTVWLLCAPTLFDVLPTIRSRARHLQLKTPSSADVAEVLVERDGVNPTMANYAARVSQGHIGRARHLAHDEAIRSRRNTILNLPFTINSLATAFSAAATLVTLATEEAAAASSLRDKKESHELGLAWGQGATGRGIAAGGAKALKELEKEQKSRATRMVRDSLDGALLDLATLYRDVLMAQSNITDSFINQEMSEDILSMAQNVKPKKVLQNLEDIMKARTNLSFNAAPLLTIEALMCSLSQSGS